MQNANVQLFISGVKLIFWMSPYLNILCIHLQKLLHRK